MWVGRGARFGCASKNIGDKRYCVSSKRSEVKEHASTLGHQIDWDIFGLVDQKLDWTFTNEKRS